jgi:putative ABC transport system ATP-binding protein
VQDGTDSLTILHDIGFLVQAGESVAITGASGSGKSTLLGLLAGLDLPTSGSVSVLNHNLTQLSEEARALLRAQHIGFVFQNFQLLDHLTALENVRVAAELSAMPKMQEACVGMLERVGLGARLHHTPKTLSGGEQQRVALARAFVRQPSLVFADEPTGSLDHATGQRVIELMFELQQEHGTTLVLVTHDAQLANRCQRQLHLDAGRMVLVR